MRTCPHCGGGLEPFKPFTVGELDVRSEHRILWKGHELDLSPALRKVLLALAGSPGRTFSWQTLANIAGNHEDADFPHELIRSIIWRLRKEVFRPIDPSFDRIVTRYGEGYTWLK
jgi:DNA-binding response OmpR family regulator